MILTAENYHSVEAQREYMSVSRYKNFAGALGLRGCEAKAMALLRGDWVDEPTNAMMVSSYVDFHFSGSLDLFKAVNPQIFTKKGELLAAYRGAENIIECIERDEYFMQYLSGQKQVIMTAELFGCRWSIMIDSYLPGVAIVDLKIMASLRQSHFVSDWGRMDFVRFYGYELQAAIYAKIVELNTGERLPFYIAAASKEKQPDREIIGFTQDDLDSALDLVESNTPRIVEVRAGMVEPDRCGMCDYCRHTKKLSKPIHFSELIE